MNSVRQRTLATRFFTRRLNNLNNLPKREQPSVALLRLRIE